MPNGIRVSLNQCNRPVFIRRIMVRNVKNFPVLYKDEWGNPWGECPVCHAKCKLDGIIKHMIRIVQGGKPFSAKHALWLKENHKQRNAHFVHTKDHK